MRAGTGRVDGRLHRLCLPRPDRVHPGELPLAERVAEASHRSQLVREAFNEVHIESHEAWSKWKR